MKIRAIITGRVQGVSFRYYTAQTAGNLGISGWVRNKEDGSVEVVAEGSEDAMQEFISFLKKGPAGARVDGIKIEKYKGELNKSFKIF